MATHGGEGQGWDSERISLGRHFVRDMETLWSRVLRMAAVVESALNNSVTALCDGRTDLAAEVKTEEAVVDRWEVEIEAECLKILALHQPVASDLRRVAAILRINNDLERMGDLAQHLAKRAKKIGAAPQVQAVPIELESLAAEALGQVRDSLDALSRGDSGLARTVIFGDRQVDRHRRSIVKQIKQSIRAQPERLNTWLHLINAAKNLERIADHATNIAESVVYIQEGEIIRHALSQAARAAKSNGHSADLD